MSSSLKTDIHSSILVAGSSRSEPRQVSYTSTVYPCTLAASSSRNQRSSDIQGLLHVGPEPLPAQVQDLLVHSTLLDVDLLDVLLNRADATVDVDAHLMHAAGIEDTIGQLFLVIGHPRLVQDMDVVREVKRDGYTTSRSRHDDDPSIANLPLSVSTEEHLGSDPVFVWGIAGDLDRFDALCVEIFVYHVHDRTELTRDH